MSDDLIAQVREALKAATPGPWKQRSWANNEGGFAAVGPYHDTEGDSDDSHCLDYGCEPGCPHDMKAQNDAALIVLLVNNAAALVERVERAKAEVERLQGGLCCYCDERLMQSQPATEDQP